MNPNNEIKYTVKADVQNFEQGMEKVKAGLSEASAAAGSVDWSNFKVNWGEGAGSIEEYNSYLKQATEESLKVSDSQAEIARYLEDVTAQFHNVGTSTEQAVSDEAELTQQTYTLSDAFEQVKGQTEGFTYAIQDSSRITRTALIAMSAAVIGIAKTSIEEYANYSKDAAATQEQLADSISRIKASIGAVLQPVVSVVASIAEWAANNRQLVAGVFTTIGVIAGGAGLIAVVVKLTQAMTILRSVSMSWLGVLGLVAGTVAAITVANADFTSGLADNSEEIGKLQEELADVDSQLLKAQGSIGGAGKAANNQIDKVQRNLEKLNHEFNQSLKQISVNHEKTLADLTKQIEEANFDYNRAIEERNAAFRESQLEEAKEHQEKVDELVAQINFLQRYNNEYNKEKLEQLRYALAREENYYKAQTEAAAEELAIQNENDRIAHEEKLASLQAELEEELAFQNKHREALQSVRDVILEDEIESLMRQRDEQIASYEEQLTNALNYGAAAGSNYSQAEIDALNARKAEIQAKIAELTNADELAKQNGISAGGNFVDGLVAFINREIEGGQGSIRRSLDNLFYNLFSGYGLRTDVVSTVEHVGGSNLGGGTWAEGGYTGAGNPTDVAGIVHRGEYVLPASMVDQSTGTPKGMGNVTINVSGTFATSAAERRKVADQIVQALNQTNNARFGAGVTL